MVEGRFVEVRVEILIGTPLRNIAIKNGVIEHRAYGFKDDPSVSKGDRRCARKGLRRPGKNVSGFWNTTEIVTKQWRTGYLYRRLEAL